MQTSGVSNWLRDHLVSWLHDEVDCDDDDHEASAVRAMMQAPRERLPLDAYRGFLDPCERRPETGFQAH